MTTNELQTRIEELVASAWVRGMIAGGPNTPSRKADELHAEVFDELRELLDEIEDAT